MTTDQIFVAARKYLGGAMESSARLCLADAIRLFDEEDRVAARQRAIDSLRYSVGILHPIYRAAVGV
jgi:hypothetical protein